MTDITVNRFKIHVREPHPAWCEIYYEGEELLVLDHRELKDLEYVIGRARDIVRSKLSEDGKGEA